MSQPVPYMNICLYSKIFEYSKDFKLSAHAYGFRTHWLKLSELSQMIGFKSLFCLLQYSISLLFFSLLSTYLPTSLPPPAISTTIKKIYIDISTPRISPLTPQYVQCTRNPILIFFMKRCYVAAGDLPDVFNDAQIVDGQAMKILSLR